MTQSQFLFSTESNGRRWCELNKSIEFPLNSLFKWKQPKIMFFFLIHRINSSWMMLVKSSKKQLKTQLVETVRESASYGQLFIFFIDIYFHFGLTFLLLLKIINKGYQHDKVNHWTKTVVDNCLGVLTRLQKPYKYIGKYKQIVLCLCNEWLISCLFIFESLHSDLYDHAKEWRRSAYS